MFFLLTNLKNTMSKPRDSSISKVVQQLLAGDAPETSLKSVTLRLSLEDYASLSALSHHLGTSVSALGKRLLSASIEQATTAFLEASPDSADDLTDRYHVTLDHLRDSLDDSAGE